MRDAATVYLPQASTLPQFVTVHQPPSAINLKPYSWHRHWMLRQPRETLSSKQGVPNQTRHAIREKKTRRHDVSSASEWNFFNFCIFNETSDTKEALSSCETPLPVCLPQSLRRQPNSYAASGVLGTICHYAPVPHQPST